MTLIMKKKKKIIFLHRTWNIERRRRYNDYDIPVVHVKIIFRNPRGTTCSRLCYILYTIIIIMRPRDFDDLCGRIEIKPYGDERISALSVTGLIVVFYRPNIQY